MANSKEIGSWLIANSKHLNLSVKNATWIKDWIPSHNNVYVEITVDGITANGSSVDKSSDLAFIKAGTEAIERLVCIENKIHSNGVAAHIDIEQAKVNAKNELLERDSFLSHFISKEPFIEPDSSILNDPLYKNISSKLNEIGVQLKVVRLKTANDKYCFACFCLPAGNDNTFSSVIGLGYSSEIMDSFHKAIFECLPSMVWHLNGFDNDKRLTKEDFSSLKEFCPDDHKNLFLGDSYISEIKEIVNHTVSMFENDKFEMNFDFNSLNSSSTLIQESPIKVVRASSKDVFNIFYGPTNPSKINMTRLRNFADKNFVIDELNLIPHCLG